MKIPQLLAPAGSMDALKAAIAAGADAVYISGQKFGARYFADNFSCNEIKEALFYAHLRGKKVYITINTLIKDEELNEVADYLLWLYQAGVDGIIVQDLGLASLTKKIVPQLPLHASTQMTIYNQQGIEWAADFGFKRVIVAREMSLEDIKKLPKWITKKIEIEVFGHGALCYSYSGQCLLSSLIGGRSGNRGMCAQTCRKPFKIAHGTLDKYGRPLNINLLHFKDNYLLSTKDLAIYPHLNQIVGSVISSIKIEGRMRSAEYVGLVVHIYRKAIDAIRKGKWKYNIKDMEVLKLAFNREFSSGYLLKDDYIVGRSSPGHRGLYIGRVDKIDLISKNATINLKSKTIPEKNDGIVFINPENEKKKIGMLITSSPILKKNRLLLKVPQGVGKKFKVYITRRNATFKLANEMIKNEVDKPQIFLDVKLTWDDDYYPTITGKAINKSGEILITYKSKTPMEKAKKHALSVDQIRKQIIRTGGTPFTFKTLEIAYPGGLFSPISLLNSFRRDFLDKVSEKLTREYLPQKEDIEFSRKCLKNIKQNLSTDKPAITNNQPKIAVWVDSLKSVNAALEAGCERIYFQPDLKLPIDRSEYVKSFFQSMLECLLEAEKLTAAAGCELIWKWPLITSKTFITGAITIMESVSNSSIHGIMVDSAGAAKTLNRFRDKIKIYGSTGMNIWNHLSLAELENQFSSLTVSPELSRNDLKKLKYFRDLKGLSIGLEILVQGNQELLISEDRWDQNKIKTIHSMEDFIGLKDSKNHIFPLKFDLEGRSIILNSNELCLINYMHYLTELGFVSLVVDARYKSPQYTQKMTEIYLKALQNTLNKSPNLNKKLDQLKDEVKKISTGSITSGSFIRGIKTAD